MKRNAIKYLYQWKASNDRKPLVMLGARQVGKTWLMQEFAKEAYNHSAYVNFEDNEMLREVFAHDFDISRIINSIQWSTGVSIDENTLIILDEIQEAPRGITALKYFAEKAPQYHVVAAGSLLGIAMHQNDSFPVGKVDFMHLYPLTFFEFLDAIGESRMVELLMKKDWNMITMFRNKFEECLRQYYLVGGMPAVVQSFVCEGNLSKVRNIQKGILEAYERDFSKHAPAIEVPRIRMVWKSIPSQLAKENKKFQYSVVKKGATASKFAGSLQWIEDAGIISRCYNLSITELPLDGNAEPDIFKVYMRDIGLFVAMLEDGTQFDILQGNLFGYKGAIFEGLIADIFSKMGRKLYYFHKDSGLEVDFVLRYRGECTLVEVKAVSGNAKSAKTILRHPEKYHVNHLIKLGDYNVGRSEQMLTLPLYMAFLLTEN